MNICTGKNFPIYGILITRWQPHSISACFLQWKFQLLGPVNYLV